MTYEVETTKTFDKEFKRLAKKYPSLKKDFAELVKELMNNPQIGTKLGNGVRKIRMGITSKNKGKSGGARVLTKDILINVEATRVHAFSIYDKSELETMTSEKIAERLKQDDLGLI